MVTTLIPLDSVRYLIVCVVGVLAFIGIAVYPAHVSLARLDKDLVRIGQEVEEKKVLFPLYTELVKKLKLKGSEVLVNPAQEKYPRDRLDGITGVFDELFSSTRMEPAMVSPDVKALTKESTSLAVTLAMTGEFLDFRDFMTGLGRMPYLMHIESFEIAQVPGSREFKVKVWLALSS